MLLGLIIVGIVVGYVVVGCAAAYVAGQATTDRADREALAIIGGAMWPVVLPLGILFWAFLKCSELGRDRA